MVGESIAFRRAALGAPLSGYGRLIDRARVNTGGMGVSSESTGDAATSTSLKTLTASATPHTKGVYTELITSTAFASETMVIVVLAGTNGSGVDTSVLMDIATGAAASEVVQIANLNLGFCINGRTLVIPFAVPAGTRVSARLQGAVVSETIGISVSLRQAGDHSAAPTVCTTHGADTATSNGTVPTVAGAINTESAWTQLVASTAATYTRLLVDVAGTPLNSHAAATGLIDIGVGAAASEVVIIPDIYFELLSIEAIYVAGTQFPYTVNIPAGSRIAFRYQATSTSTAARPTVVVHGF